MDKKTQSFILNLAHRNPHLGVRSIASLLKKDHNLSVSKSTVNNVLLRHKKKSSPGRKREVLRYAARDRKNCFFTILEAVDSAVGIFDYLAESLASYFPRIKKANLNRDLALLAFAAFSRCEFDSLSLKDFARCFGFGPVVFSRLRAVREKIKQNHLTLDFAAVRDNLSLVSSIKITFANGRTGFCDAGLATLWDKNCHISHFFMPLRQAKIRVESILRDKLFIVCYTKSFDYLSRVAVDFINNLSSGISHIEILSPRGDVLWSRDVSAAGFSFVIGYYPKSLSRGLTFLEKAKRFKKIEVIGRGIFYLPVVTSFSPPQDKKAVILNNILLRRVSSGMPSWALLTNKRTRADFILKKYLHIWPQAEKDFNNDMAIIEKFYTQSVTRVDIKKFCPQRMVVADYYDFASIVPILEDILKENIAVSVLKTKNGRPTYTKEVVQLTISGLSRAQKDKFNRACFFIGRHRVLID